MAPNGPSPFGLTADGLKDFRGAPIATLKRLTEAHFSETDFSYANFENLWIEKCHFDQSRFSAASLMHVSEHQNHFVECRFDATDFRLAHLGFSTSRYEACCFELPWFTKTGFINPVFEHCSFTFRAGSKIDFGCSGFWDCRLAGGLGEATFRGAYQYASDRENYPAPVMTGLHGVDFLSAKLKWISLQNECEIEGLLLPQEGLSFIYHRDEFLSRAPEVATSLSSPDRHTLLVLCRVVGLHAKNQATGCLCLGDLMDISDEHAALELFALLKDKFQLGLPYVIPAG